MISSKLSVLFFAFAFSASARAFSTCGFDVPDAANLHFHREDGCSVSVLGKKNYAGLDFLEFYEHRGIDELLSDDTFFITEDGKKYFVSEEVDDPRITVNVIRQGAATPISFNGLSGFSAKTGYFVQVLPNGEERKAASYSLKISCTFVAAGNQQKSFKGRFCVPETVDGRRLMATYRSLITKIHP
jgi:hypothetical protein